MHPIVRKSLSFEGFKTMKRYIRIIFAVSLLSNAFFPVSADTKITTSVIPSFLSPSDVYSDPVIPDEVFVSRKYIHFSEDYQADKNVRSYIDRPSFMVFTLKDGRLVRDTFFILNPEGIDDNGFYRLQCDIVKKEVRPTIRIYDVRVVRIQKSATRMDDVRRSLSKKLTGSAGVLAAADLTPLYNVNPQGVKLKNLKEYVSAPHKSRGIDSLEYICGGNGRHLLRFLLSNADSEKQKVERNTARGYFCYVYYDTVRDRIDCYYVLVDYSIYIK